MQFSTTSAKLAFLICGGVSQVFAQADSRLAEIAAQQEQKATDVRPDEAGKVERALLAVREHDLVCLIERRNKIVDAFLTGTAALDRFEVRQDRLEWAFVGRNAAEPVQVQWSAFDNETGARRVLAGETSPQMPRSADAAYLVAELSDGRGPAVSVYVRNAADRQFVIGVERSFPGWKAN